MIRWYPNHLIFIIGTPYLERWFLYWNLAQFKVYVYLCYHILLFSLFVLWSLDLYRDHFANALSQWETMLHYNVVSHWLGVLQNGPCLYIVSVMSCMISLVVLYYMCIIKWPRSGVTFMFSVRFRRVCHIRRRKNFSLSCQNHFS